MSAQFLLDCKSPMEKPCTLLLKYDNKTPAFAIKSVLEGHDVPDKIDAMKQAIALLLSGVAMPQLFITVFRYVPSSEDHKLQKLMLLYLEIVEKTDSRGEMLGEMILICQTLMNNLNHPNEYIRGVTLRFLCRLREADVMEPLIPSVVLNLDHKCAFVRRNAILALMSIYKLSVGNQLVDNYPDLIEKVFEKEYDHSARRNAFHFLVNFAEERAVNYVLGRVHAVDYWRKELQLEVLHLIRNVWRENRGVKEKYVEIILSLLGARSVAVTYECAGTIVSLSLAPDVMREAAKTYCQILISQSDNNVKLIVLDRISELKESHREVMVDMVMDIIRATSSQSLDVRRKTVEIVLDLVTRRNIHEVVLVLKKEVMRTQSADIEKNDDYQQMLVEAIHSCAVKYPEVAGSVVHLLMDFLGDSNVDLATDVVVFVREIAETNPTLRAYVVQRLLDKLDQICTVRVCSCALWIIGVYCMSLVEVESGIATIMQCLGDTPFCTVPEEEESGDALKNSQVVNSPTLSCRRPAILADGTYATQSAVSPPTAVQESLESNGDLRTQITTGNFSLAAIVASTLTKLVLRLEEVQPLKVEVNKATAQALLSMVYILQLGKSSFVSCPIDDDSYVMIVLCTRLLCNTGGQVRKTWLQSCRLSFASMLADKQFHEAAEIRKAQLSHAQPDERIEFYNLKGRKGTNQVELEADLKSDTGEFLRDYDGASNPNCIFQLTGVDDPVYAEAYVRIHDHDIVLDVTLYNRTKETLQNVCLELETTGDLKLVEGPQDYTLGPKSSKQIRAKINVSSTGPGKIFGNIHCEFSNVLERKIIVLNYIHIDVMKFIFPSTCADVAFRTMWAEFGWESKVTMCTSIQDEKELLDCIMKATNAKCISSPSTLEGECGFLAANLYAKSVFGEDALINLSIEKNSGVLPSGRIRIRSKTKGIVQSLGDRMVEEFGRA
ncbi:hypothetical protein RJ640_008292 [Escallonia rubra]|uniref:Coatomer subunit beta n=1 Tax=Escallonia rubra TaxID=112253 RepID=A0AA88QIC2_9ASTE|nr:hypothetical protein RJ640_008292 [Escallonia rubra]